MTSKDKAVRWIPVGALPELPLGALDMAYVASENRLTISAFFRDISNWFPGLKPPATGLIIEFENVQAFKAYEEFTDPIYAEGLDVPLLAEDVPYGGTWGFIQILESSWLERLGERNGDWEVLSASHWVVKTGDMVLHVASNPSVAPTFRSWIAGSAPAHSK